MSFTSPTWGKLSLEEMTDKIKSFLSEEHDVEYKIVIGTDSQTSKKGTLFVSALIVHRVGKGAIFFFRKVRTKPLHDLRYRIYKETELSLALMEYFRNEGVADLLSAWPIEIHIDIGQQGETKKLIKEIVGWVTSVGYIAKIKPSSYGASSVADRFTN